jgi:hypothetical protein
MEGDKPQRPAAGAGATVKELREAERRRKLQATKRRMARGAQERQAYTGPMSGKTVIAVIGPYHGGSTLLGAMLASHPQGDASARRRISRALYAGTDSEAVRAG